MKPAPALSTDTLMEAPLENLRRLGRALGIRVATWEGLPDEKFCLARAIGKWYKDHPQKRKKRPVGGRRDRLCRG